MNRSALRILIGLALGLIGGALASGRPLAVPMLAITVPVGRLWLDALTMTVVPLVFSLLVTGILGAAQDARQDRVALRALLWFAALLCGGCLAAAASTTLLLHLWPVGDVGALRPVGTVPAIGGAGDWLGNIIPTNPIKAAAETAMVPLVVFALFFGFGAARVAPELQRALRTMFRAIAETMLVIVQWVLLVAPLGVFALAFGLGARAGGGAVAVLAHYVVIVACACLLIGVLAYVVVLVFGGLSPVRFARAAPPPRSSPATSPATIAAAAPLGVPRNAAGIVLPLAVSVFRAASAAANIAVALYLAAVYGVSPGIGMLVTGALVAAAVSLAAVGLPAQVSFFATIGPVCLALGVPVELLPLLLAVETIPDLFRTVGNVTRHGGDAASRRG